MHWVTAHREYNHFTSSISKRQYYDMRISKNWRRLKKWMHVHANCGVMTRSMVDAFSEERFPCLKGGNSAFTTAIASGLFLQTEYRSLE